MNDWDYMRIPPEEAERAMLNLAMTNPIVMDEVDLSAADFGRQAYAALYSLLSEMNADGVPTDLPNVIVRIPNLQYQGHQVRIARDEVERISCERPPLAHGDSYAKIIRDEATRRRILEASARMAQGVKEGMDIEELVEMARAEVDNSSRRVAKGWDMGAEYDEYVSQIGTERVQYPTMWPRLNDAIGGYRPGALYVVGARPGVGKSIYGVQSVLDLIKHGNVVVHSMEMNRDEIFDRLTANVTSINTRRLDGSGGQMRVEDWETLEMHRQFMRNLPLSLDDRASVTMNQIRSHVRTVSRKGKVAGLVVDYLSLIQGKPWQRSRYEIVSDVSREMKVLAKDFDIPVIVLAQLNREAAGTKPGLHHLRDSGTVEQDANVVLMLHQEETGEFSMMVEKNRQGPNGVQVPMVRRGEYSRLEEVVPLAQMYPTTEEEA